MTRPNDTIALINEALALEKAGGTWSQAHVAAVTGYGVTSIRNSDCPKHYERGPNSTIRPKLIYLPHEVRAWKAGLLKKAS